MGAMTPVTLPAALIQQNAEALFTIALVQSKFQGAPVIYGGFTSNVDMKSGAPAFGTPENSRANMIGGQLARVIIIFLIEPVPVTHRTQLMDKRLMKPRCRYGER